MCLSEHRLGMKIKSIYTDIIWEQCDQMHIRIELTFSCIHISKQSFHTYLINELQVKRSLAFCHIALELRSRTIIICHKDYSTHSSYYSFEALLVCIINFNQVPDKQCSGVCGKIKQNWCFQLWIGLNK